MSEYPAGHYVTELVTTEESMKHAIVCGDSLHVIFDNGEFMEVKHSEKEVCDLFGLNNPGITIKNEFRYICRYVDPKLELKDVSIHDTELTAEELEEQLDNNNE